LSIPRGVPRAFRVVGHQPARVTVAGSSLSDEEAQAFKAEHG
jgi:hypothetical protein